MMPYYNISANSAQDAASQLDDQQFEFLIRAYIKRQLERIPSQVGGVALNIGIVQHGEAKGEFIHQQWTVGSYTDNAKTQGEILAQVTEEYIRRLGFEQTNRLLLIEHEEKDQEPNHPGTLEGESIPY